MRQKDAPLAGGAHVRSLSASGQSADADRSDGGADTTSPCLPESFSGGEEAAFSRFAIALGLTPREEEVFSHLIKGCTSAQIAQRMFVSRNTVLTHLKSIYRKADVHSKADILDLYEGFETSSPRD